MTLVYIAAGAVLCIVLALATYIQTLYLESLRLRARESAAFTYFKETLEARLHRKTEEGVLAFSLIKHSSILLLGVVALAAAYGAGEGPGRALLEAMLVSWAAMLGAGYLIPQFLYRKAGAAWLRPFVPLARLLELCTRPLTSTLLFFQSLAELGSPQNGQEAPTPAEHIEAIITAGHEEGIIQEEDRKLIQSAVAFTDKTVREVMTPRPKIVAIGRDKTLEDLRQLAINEQFSRVPVYEDTIDNIVGFVHVRDMFQLDAAEREHRKVAELVREIQSVPETKHVSELLNEMRESGAHIVVVVDEYGSTAGLATLEDLVEELVGEIRDEHEPASDVTAEPDGSYLVAGSFDVDGLHDLLGFRPPDETESTTVGGLVTEWMGRVPDPGEAVEREGIRIEVLASNERRVDQVRISRTGDPRNGARSGTTPPEAAA